MKPSSYKKEIDIVSLLKRQMNSRKIIDIVGLSQSKVNRIRKKQFKNIIMPRGSRSQPLTTWEKRYVVRLVIVGVEAIRELKSASEANVCVETRRNALKEAGLGLAEKVSRPSLSAKNVKERLEFAKMYKNWKVWN
jgi:hypothetical protein